MFVKFRLASKPREEIWINPNNVFAVKDACYVGTHYDEQIRSQAPFRANRSYIYSDVRHGALGERYITVEGSAHETLTKLRSTNL